MKQETFEKPHGGLFAPLLEAGEGAVNFVKGNFTRIMAGVLMISMVGCASAPKKSQPGAHNCYSKGIKHK